MEDSSGFHHEHGRSSCRENVETLILVGGLHVRVLTVVKQFFFSRSTGCFRNDSANNRNTVMSRIIPCLLCQYAVEHSGFQEST